MFDEDLYKPLAAGLFSLYDTLRECGFDDDHAMTIVLAHHKLILEQGFKTNE